MVVSFNKRATAKNKMVLSSGRSVFIAVPSAGSVVVAIFTTISVLILMCSRYSRPLSGLQGSNFPDG